MFQGRAQLNIRIKLSSGAATDLPKRRVSPGNLEPWAIFSRSTGAEGGPIVTRYKDIPRTRDVAQLGAAAEPL